MPGELLQFECPWCGEANRVEAEPGDAGQWLVQDCEVCCSPIEIRLPGAGQNDLVVRREAG
ncbi:MAG: CPXCG motif-containing cysteine-rich protein [Wenzhouxiangellaceae bacterium]|nr:CPXCG motif-containing cysteine-rich protein [Wenzhouxiangellaceae bacterium]